MSFPVWGGLRRAVVAALALSFVAVASADVPVYSETLSHVESASRNAEEKLNAGRPIDVDLFTGTASLSIRPCRGQRPRIHSLMYAMPALLLHASKAALADSLLPAPDPSSHPEPPCGRQS